ncbi:MAG: carbohydrate kinase [Ornithinimicrobium sp.]
MQVLAVGEALIDIVKSADGEVNEHVGGSPANVAMGVAALGHPTLLATHIGRDARGQRIKSHLAERGVELTPGSEDAEHTSTATATLDEEGGATYDFDLAWELAATDLSGVGHVHTGSIAATLQPGGSAVFDLISAARSGATVSYDPNVRPTIMGSAHEARSTIEERIGRCDVVKASAEDLEWLYPGATPDDVARLWARLGPELVIVTDGGKGAFVQHGLSAKVSLIKARDVTVVDTVGAGDSFMAGLISGLLDAELLGSAAARDRMAEAPEHVIVAAIERATATSAFTVTRAGAAAPTRADLDITSYPSTPPPGDE